MSVHKTQKNKNVLALVIISAIASVFFSFVGAPFMRALFISTRSRVFWTTAVLLVGAMFAAGTTNYKISETAIYVGALWITLGVYCELEMRGVRWIVAGLVSLGTSLLFAFAGYFLILKNLTTIDMLAEIVEPLRLAINKTTPELQQEAGPLVKALPGIFVASLLASLAFGFVFEAKVIKIFKIQEEKVASGLRWLDLRLPSTAIWLLLIVALYTELTTKQNVLRDIGDNLLIVLAVAFFFQGIAIVESMLRFYRLGQVTRVIMYILIVLQLAPLIIFVGFADYWADFRLRMRKKSIETI